MERKVCVQAGKMRKRHCKEECSLPFFFFKFRDTTTGSIPFVARLFT